MLPVFTNPNLLSLEDVQAFPRQSLPLDWFGTILQAPPFFILARDPQTLWFIAGAASIPQYNRLLPCGTFEKDLWKLDVAELFLSLDDKGHYQEFNLSPGGAWWSASFERPREPEAKQTRPEVSCYCSFTERSWTAALRINLSSLPKDLAHCRANVCFILESPQQRFVSFCKIDSAKPDFHRPDCFEEMNFINSTDR